MQSSNQPVVTKISVPFANDGDKTDIPETTVDPFAASMTLGFPYATSLPVEEGGEGPTYEDFNGIFYRLSDFTRWSAAGGGYKFNSQFATDVGGYPKGAVILKADESGYWFSTIDNNTNDPDLSGTGWVDLINTDNLLATQVGIQNQQYTAFSTTGTAPDFELTTAPDFLSYSANQRFRVKFSANASSPTLSINGLAAKDIKQYDIGGSKIPAVVFNNQLADVEYDGVDFVVLTPILQTPQLKVVKFTANGTFTAPVNVTKAIVTLCGGGGGGGGKTRIDGDPDYLVAGYGGYSGDVIYKEPVTLTPGASYSVVIGSGGAGGAGAHVTPSDVNIGSNGGNGGVSSFGSILSANGGSGGRRGIPDGFSTEFGNPSGANGLSSIIGLGGILPVDATNDSGPIDGIGPGGGGSGDYSIGVDYFVTYGGNGANGICIIEYVE